MRKVDTTQLRNDLAWLQANGFDTSGPRALLNRHRANGTLHMVIRIATQRVHAQRVAADPAVRGGQERYRAGRAALLASGPVPEKGRGRTIRQGCTLANLRAARVR